MSLFLTDLIKLCNEIINWYNMNKRFRSTDNIYKWSFLINKKNIFLEKYKNIIMNIKYNLYIDEELGGYRFYLFDKKLYDLFLINDTRYYFIIYKHIKSNLVI